MAAEQLRVPAEQVPSPHAHSADGSCVGAEVFSWDSGRHYSGLSAEDVTAAQEFLRAHDIEPLSFIIGNPLVVRARCDGGLWLDTWRATATGPDGYLLCEHCPHCIRQERVTVPLVAPVPAAFVPGAYVKDVALGVVVCD